MLQKKQAIKAPLVVREIILPEKEKKSLSQNFNNAKLQCNTINSRSNCLKIGNHEVKSLDGLISLDKKVQENYFRGTRQRKLRKKVKQQTVNHSLNELLEESGNEAKESTLFTVEALAYQEIKQNRKVRKQLEKYQKHTENCDRKIHVKQRLAEQKYINEQENLVETWMEYLKRKNQMKEKGFQNNKTHRKTYCNDRISISIISRKYWHDEEDEGKVEKKPESKPKQVADDLREKFLNALVFVDESNDELKCDNSRRQN